MSKTKSASPIRRWLVSRNHSSRGHLLVTASDEVTVSDFDENKALKINHVHMVEDGFIVVASVGSKFYLWACGSRVPSSELILQVDTAPFTEWFFQSGDDEVNDLLDEPLVRAAILEPFFLSLVDNEEWPRVVDCGSVPSDGACQLPCVSVSKKQDTLIIRSFSDAELSDGLRKIIKSSD